MKRTLKLKLHTQWDRHDKKFRFMFWQTDMRAQGYTFVKDVELEIECPDDAELTAATVKVMRDQLTTCRAEAQKRLLSMEDDIRELLAIEHKPVSESGCGGDS